MFKKVPDWMPQIREFCRSQRITIMAWGPETLVVESKSSERGQEIAGLLNQLGFKAVDDENDKQAGILTLRRNA